MEAGQPQIDALDRVTAHVRSETTNVIDTIMGTVSQSVCYIMPDVSDPALPISVLTRRDEVRDYYREERDFLEIVGSADLVEVSSDWYVFHEGVATTTEVRTGKNFDHTYVVLFPVADDGIIGEILWPRQSLADLYAGKPVPGLLGPSPASSDRRKSNQETHDRYLEALRIGDADGAVACWDPAARMAVRQSTDSPRILHGAGLGVVRRRVTGLVDAVADREVRVLARVVGDWYVFVEWVLRGRHADLRMASIHPMSIHPVSGEAVIQGELGYGLDALV